MEILESIFYSEINGVRPVAYKRTIRILTKVVRRCEGLLRATDNPGYENMPQMEGDAIAGKGICRPFVRVCPSR